MLKMPASCGMAHSRDFPFKEQNGIFQAWVPLRDATFQFGAGWLPLREMSLDLLFENDRLDMQGDRALLGDASSPRLHAWFPKLAPGARLYIDADIAGTGEAVSVISTALRCRIPLAVLCRLCGFRSH